jgi:hypothetical protein
VSWACHGVGGSMWAKKPGWPRRLTSAKATGDSARRAASPPYSLLGQVLGQAGRSGPRIDVGPSWLAQFPQQSTHGRHEALFIGSEIVTAGHRCPCSPVGDSSPVCAVTGSRVAGRPLVARP